MCYPLCTVLSEPGFCSLFLWEVSVACQFCAPSPPIFHAYTCQGNSVDWGTQEWIVPLAPTLSGDLVVPRFLLGHFFGGHLAVYGLVQGIHVTDFLFSGLLILWKIVNFSSIKIPQYEAYSHVIKLEIIEGKYLIHLFCCPFFFAHPWLFFVVSFNLVLPSFCCLVWWIFV